MTGTALQGSVQAADKAEVAISMMEFGGSIGSLLWVTQQSVQKDSESNPNRYTRLANSIKDRIDAGRASSSLVRANFNVVFTTLAYSSAVDPEPMSKVALGVAAWSAKKTGDWIGGLVIEQSQKQAQDILAQGLKESGFSETEVRGMSAEQLKARVPDLKVGGQILRDILKDDPESLQRLQAHAADVATTIASEAFSRADGAQRTADTVRDDLKKTKITIDEYQKEVGKRLDRLNIGVANLAKYTIESTAKLDLLRQEVGTNTKAIQALAQVSFSGWSTAQKLQAVQSGFFIELGQKQKDALIESLKADQKREVAIASIQRTAGNLGSLAIIAGNLGLSRDAVKSLQGAQTIATGIAQFATGNYLGAVANVTSLVGLGAPDAGAARHAQMMKYLSQQFEQINRKLDKIIELQIATLDAISKLSEEQRRFRQEILAQLDQIETAVLRTETTVQAILLNEWQPCRALRTVFNGQYTISNKDVLKAIANNPNTASHASGCYKQMIGFLDGNVKPADWSGQIIAALNFQAAKISANPEIQAGWAVYAAQKEKAFASARDAVVGKLNKASAEPAPALARLSQPVVNAKASAKLASVLATPAVRDKLARFKCNEKDVLAPALVDLICFGRSPGDSVAPLTERWGELVNATLIGPQSRMILDVGVALSLISDLARRTPEGSFVFPDWTQISAASNEGVTADLQTGLEQHKSHTLLDKLRWLAEANVLQQSIVYGDYTAELATAALYDPATNSLNPARPEAPRFLEAMKMNPVLARNVVLLAMRRAIEATLGGADKAEEANYRETYYALAVEDFSAPAACDEGRSKDKLSDIFPKWNFEFRATASQKEQSYKNCKLEYIPAVGGGAHLPEMGAGATLKMSDDFYILIPSALHLSTGTFDIPDSLRVALAYRDKISQAIVDLSIGEVLKSQINERGEKLSDDETQQLALDLINEGWGWQHRKN
ncbi:hypothetical protein [Methylobacterium sp. WL8]|uniref:hypothetical protein n=1 Tax=Methylobacterium sp. WL8 TaxID=2603899 RepID=UPI0011C825AA|nr:hypothetical protein [Methylobacterium sp. WL8]TXN76056.1 hypothetical protein FV234_24775 [Methylobacterium sp. WL8]